MKKLLLAIVLVAALILFWLGAGGRTPAEPLVMGTGGEFAPFRMRGEGDPAPWKGFDIDLGRAIAEKAGRPLEIREMDAEALIPALEEGLVDMVVASLTITAERAERVDFSEPYYDATPVVLIRVGEEAPETREDLRGRKIGVREGTTSHEWARDWTYRRDLRVASSARGMVVDLLNSQADFTLMDAQPVADFLRMFPEVTEVPLDFDEEFYGVAVQKGNEELLALINGTLRTLKMDRRYDALIDRWLLQAD